MSHLIKEFSFDDLTQWKPVNRGHTETSVIKEMEVFPRTSVQV